MQLCHRSVSNVTMPYGGVRRRPGPLLGGSAILAKRNNQQRLQYLQQLQNLVHQKESDCITNEQNVENFTKTSTANIQKNSASLDKTASHQALIDPGQSLLLKSENMISNPYPDLLSHEVPQHSVNANANYYPSEVHPIPNNLISHFGFVNKDTGINHFLLYATRQGK